MEKSGNVWVVSELYYPEETSTAHYLTKIAEGLAQRYPTHVLCVQPSYSQRGKRAPRRERHNNVEIQRCWSTTFSKDRFLLRIINLITISFSVFLRALTAFRRGDVVIVVTNPPTLPFLVALAGWLRGAQTVLLIHDVYPEVLVAANLADEDGLLVRVLDAVTRRLYRSAARVVVLGRDMRELAGQKLDGQWEKIRIIPNWADLNFIRPLPREDNPFLEELGLQEKFVVQYSGNLGQTHDGESLLASVRQMATVNSSVHFLFVISGSKADWFRNEVEHANLANITVLPRQPLDVLPLSLSACDIAIVAFKPRMLGVSVPSRMYNIMGSGRPLLAVADGRSELAQVVDEEQIGWVVPPGDPSRINATIQDVLSCRDDLSAIGARARSVAEARFSLREVVQAYQDLVADIWNDD